MRSQNFCVGFTASFAILFVSIFATVLPMAAQQETLLYSFRDNNSDGTEPVAALVFDAAGNLYGTTISRGAYNYGSVYELSPQSGGNWKEKLLHSFNSNGKDGFNPTASLILDAAGNLYGTTSLGGSHSGGTVFELSPQPGDQFSERILHNFTPGLTDGSNPIAGLVFDAAGNLYGDTVAGGAHNNGVVFELIPVSSGRGWSERLIHAFDGRGGGAIPFGTLVFDFAGNLYGTTQDGGIQNNGIVFELSPTASGPWTETVLHSFTGGPTDGSAPEAGVVFDSAGNLYGTTYGGGTFEYGTVFKLSPNGDGSWSESFVHYFDSIAPDGYLVNSVIVDASGNLYTTTAEGGKYSYGTVLEFSLGGGSWNEITLHSFNYAGTNDGDTPKSGLIFDAAGNLYGTTQHGGRYNEGTVFKVTP